VGTPAAVAEATAAATSDVLLIARKDKRRRIAIRSGAAFSSS